MWPLIIPAAVSLFSSLFGSHEQKKASDTATQASVAAQNHAADLEKQAADEALAETRRQSQQALYSNEAARKGNYGIYAAGQRRLGTLSQLAGFGAREIPDYVPDPGVAGGGGGSGAPSAASGPAPAIDPSKGDIGQQVSAYFKSRGVSDQETPYWVQKWSEFGSKDPAYFNQRLAAADIFGGGAPAATATPPPGSLASYALPQVLPPRRVLTPALTPGGY